jgi:hypothetical protein
MWIDAKVIFPRNRDVYCCASSGNLAFVFIISVRPVLYYRSRYVQFYAHGSMHTARDFNINPFKHPPNCDCKLREASCLLSFLIVPLSAIQPHYIKVLSIYMLFGWKCAVLSAHFVRIWVTVPHGRSTRCVIWMTCTKCYQNLLNYKRHVWILKFLSKLAAYVNELNSKWLGSILYLYRSRLSL